MFRAIECFELSINNARDQHQYRHKWGKIGPSHFLNENGDLFFYCFFFETILENIQGKFQKIHRQLLFLRNHVKPEGQKYDLANLWNSNSEFSITNDLLQETGEIQVSKLKDPLKKKFQSNLRKFKVNFLIHSFQMTTGMQTLTCL